MKITIAMLKQNLDKITNAKGYNKDLQSKIKIMSEEKGKVEIENEKLHEIIVTLEREESNCKETFDDLMKTKMKNKKDFVKEVAEVKIKNVELLDKLQEVETERKLITEEIEKMKDLQDQMEKVMEERDKMKKDLQQVKNENHVLRVNSKELWEYKKRARDKLTKINRNRKN